MQNGLLRILRTEKMQFICTIHEEFDWKIFSSFLTWSHKSWVVIKTGAASLRLLFRTRVRIFSRSWWNERDCGISIKKQNTHTKTTNKNPNWSRNKMKQWYYVEEGCLKQQTRNRVLVDSLTTSPSLARSVQTMFSFKQFARGGGIWWRIQFQIAAPLWCQFRIIWDWSFCRWEQLICTFSSTTKLQTRLHFHRGGSLFNLYLSVGL